MLFYCAFLRTENFSYSSPNIPKWTGQGRMRELEFVTDGMQKEKKSQDKVQLLVLKIGFCSSQATPLF